VPERTRRVIQPPSGAMQLPALQAFAHFATPYRTGPWIEWLAGPEDARVAALPNKACLVARPGAKGVFVWLITPDGTPWILMTRRRVSEFAPARPVVYNPNDPVRMRCVFGRMAERAGAATQSLSPSDPNRFAMPRPGSSFWRQWAGVDERRYLSRVRQAPRHHSSNADAAPRPA
jgi:hypothetical protein